MRASEKMLPRWRQIARGWVRVTRCLGVALLVFYASSAVLLVTAEELLLRWHDHSGTVQGSGTDVWLRTDDGVRIYGRYYERDPALPVLLYLHGGAGTLASRSDRLELFANLGANLFALEYRGYGPSEGTSSDRGVERDAGAAYRWLLERTPATKVIPFGESFGGAPATWLARFHPVGGLILLSAYTSPSELFAHFMPWLPTDLLVRTRFDNLRRIKRVNVPKLFIHSRSDEIAPFHMGEALWTAAPEPKQHLWLDGIGHDETFYAARNEATDAIRAFLLALSR